MLPGYIIEGKQHMTTSLLDARRYFVGSSDVGALIGANPWTTRYALWAEKAGKIERDTSDSEVMFWGRLLEPLIAKAWAIRHNAEIDQKGRRVHFVPERLSAEVDYFISPGFKPPGALTPRPGGILEVKTVGLRMSGKWGEPWTDEVPEEYYCQVIWQMGLHNRNAGEGAYTYAVIAALFGGQKLESYLVEYDHEMFLLLEAQAQNFWQLVDSGREPPPEWNDLQLVKQVHDRVRADSVLLASAEAAAAHGELLAHRAEIAELQKEADRLAALLVSFMGDAEELVSDAGETLATRRAHRRAIVDYKAALDEVLKKSRSKALRRWASEALANAEKSTSYRTLRIKEPKS